MENKLKKFLKDMVKVYIMLSLIFLMYGNFILFGFLSHIFFLTYNRFIFCFCFLMLYNCLITILLLSKTQKEDKEK